MNVRDLAPSMMAVGGFFEAANRVTNGGRASICVNLRATSASSFHIGIQVVQNLEAVGVLEANIGDILATANSRKELLIGGGGVAGGIFALIKGISTPQARSYENQRESLQIRRRRRDL